MKFLSYEFTIDHDTSEVFPCLKEMSDNLKSLSHNGITATLLDSPLAIKIESDTMKHCVCAYVGGVANGDYLMYHLENAEGGEPTTLGIWQCNGVWDVHQHYGPCNSTLPTTENHIELTTIICEKLNEGE